MEMQTKTESYTDNADSKFTQIVYIIESYRDESARILGDYDASNNIIRLFYINDIMKFREANWAQKTIEYQLTDINFCHIYLTNKKNVSEIYDESFVITTEIKDNSERLTPAHISKIATFDSASENNKKKLIYDGNIIILPDNTIRCTDTAISHIHNIRLNSTKDTENIKFEHDTLYIPRDNRICDLYHDLMLSPLLQNVNIYGYAKDIKTFYDKNIISKYTTIYITDYNLNRKIYNLAEYDINNIYGIIQINSNGEIISK